MTRTGDWKRCRSAEWTGTQTERRRKSPSDSLSWGTPDLELLSPQHGGRRAGGHPWAGPSAVRRHFYFFSRSSTGDPVKRMLTLPREAGGSDGFYPLEGRLSPSFPPGNPVTISVVPMLQKSRDGLVKVSRKVFSLNPL